jgi:5'-nucleotidase
MTTRKLRLETADGKTHDVVAAKAENLILRTDTCAKDPDQTALIAAYDGRAKAIADRVVGSITASLPRAANAAGEAVLGDIIVDAQLAATRAEQDGGAAIAITNPGGVRTDILRRGDGAVTFADLFAAQPFNNGLVTMTLTGAQIKTMLEQQWLGQTIPRVLHVSRNFPTPGMQRVRRATVSTPAASCSTGGRSILRRATTSP